MKPIVLLMSLGLLGWWYAMVPLQVMVAATAAARGRWRLAVFSLAAPALAIGAVLVARAAVDRHPDGFDRVGVVLPSGHSALVVVVVTTLAALVSPRWSRRRAAVAAALILAVSGVMLLGGHTIGDVLIGMALGGASVAVAGMAARLRRPRRRASAQ